MKEVIPTLNIRIVLPRRTVVTWRKQLLVPGATERHAGIKRW